MWSAADWLWERCHCLLCCTPHTSNTILPAKFYHTYKQGNLHITWWIQNVVPPMNGQGFQTWRKERSLKIQEYSFASYCLVCHKDLENGDSKMLCNHSVGDVSMIGFFCFYLFSRSQGLCTTGLQSLMYKSKRFNNFKK